MQEWEPTTMIDFANPSFAAEHIAGGKSLHRGMHAGKRFGKIKRIDGSGFFEKTRRSLDDHREVSR
jgi:hypothetical protein